VSSIEISEELLQRLQIVAEKDYEGVTLDDALDRLLREHQEYVVIEAASELERNAARLADEDQPSR
jgi:rRNA-processing protein FCF1